MRLHRFSKTLPVPQLSVFFFPFYELENCRFTGVWKSMNPIWCLTFRLPKRDKKTQTRIAVSSLIISLGVDFVAAVSSADFILWQTKRADAKNDAAHQSQVHSESCSSSYSAIKWAMTAKYTGRLAKVCRSDPAVPEHTSPHHQERAETPAITEGNHIVC